MKILVLGAGGMAGHTIAIFLRQAGHDVFIASRNPVLDLTRVVEDVTNFNELERVILGNDFDVIINAVGILNQNAENHPDYAVLVNSYLPHFLVSITANLKTKVIHMSTDCVFSGLRGAYKESDMRDGKTFYDRTKALGEIENRKDLTFRNSIIGPDMKDDGIGLFNWFMKQNGTIHGYTNAIWTGVTTLTLAKAMCCAIDENLTGLYHLVNNTSISKFDLLNLFNRVFKQNKLNVVKDDSVQVDKSLINTRYDFSFSVPDYESMIVEMKDWILAHKQLYPHYHI